MAESPAHKFGQIIGNMIETIARPLLADFCRSKGFYLDYHGNDRQARQGKKLIWTDRHGNSHDLDYVIEKDGTNKKIGVPVAFIEVAWRRYTKHSRNKAQEIQGAILPLAEKYKWNSPFLGTILAGIFTSNSISQLKSLGFNVLYFPYETIIDAFKTEGINIVFDEKTSEAEFRKCVKTIESCHQQKIKRVEKKLINANKSQIDSFLESLENRLSRIVEKIIIIPLYGSENEFSSFKQAFSFLDKLDPKTINGEFRKYEIIVKFSNDDKIDAEFSSKESVREFLKYLAS